MMYGIVYAETAQELADKMARNIANGWKPQGGIATTVIGTNVTLYQAMVKKSAKTWNEKRYK